MEYKVDDYFSKLSAIFVNHETLNQIKMTRVLILVVLLSAIFQNTFINCFKINPEAEVDVIVATNITKFLEENPDTVELKPSAIEYSVDGAITTYRLGNRVTGINK